MNIWLCFFCYRENKVFRGIDEIYLVYFGGLGKGFGGDGVGSVF